MFLQDFKRQTILQRKISSTETFCVIGEKIVAAKVDKFPFSSYSLVTVLRNKDLVPLWRYIQKISGNKSYWLKIISLWFLLDGKNNPVRIVEGYDNHWWIEFDFPQDLLVFDWNAYKYRQKTDKWGLSRINQPTQRKGEAILIFDKKHQIDILFDNELYLVKYTDTQLTEKLKDISEQWVTTNLNITWDQFKELVDRSSLLKKDFEEWRKVSPKKTPKVP